MSTQTITEFLEARIAEDEATARGAYYEGQRWYSEDEFVGRYPDCCDCGCEVMIGANRKIEATHIATWHPSRVLAECAAKRAAIGAASAWRHDYNDEDMWYSCPLAAGIDETAPGSGYSGDDDPACRCGLEARQHAILAPLAAVYADHPDYQQDWAS